MAKQTINLGNSVNDGTGDVLRVGAQKINSNFTELYNLLGGESISIVSQITAGPGLIASSSSGDVTISSRPASSTDIGMVKVGDGITVDDTGTISTTVYSLPTAATNILGGIRVGNNLAIDNNGVLSAVTQSYTLPTASISTLGGIKIGTGLSIDNGVVSVVTSDIASALVSGPVSVSLDDTDSAGTLTASGALTILTKDAGNYLRLQHVLDTETPNLRNVVELNNTGLSITSYDEENEILNQWAISSTVLSSGVLVLNSAEGAGISTLSGNTLQISGGADVQLSSDNGDQTWIFDQDGNLTLPESGDILNAAGESVLLPTVIDTLNNGDFEVSLSSSGVLTIPGSIGSFDQLELQSTTDTSIVAGTDLKLFSNGLFALRNYSTADGIAIITNFNNLNQKSWLFNTTGSITLPTAAVPSTAKGAPGDQKGMFIVDDDYIYYCKETYTDGVADIWNRTAQTPWSN
jgi:hypothetical protein